MQSTAEGAHLASFSSLLIGSMKLISSQFRERAGSDKLYHLKLLIITTYSNVSLEKNEVITISPYQMNYGAENLYLNFPPGITINILLHYKSKKNFLFHFSYLIRVC